MGEGQKAWAYHVAGDVWLPIQCDATGRLIVSSEMAIESGVATGGTNNTLVDTTKDWEVNMWADAILEVVIAGIEYHRTVLSNTNDTLTFNALPALVVVAAGDHYEIRRIVSPLSPLARAEVHNAAVVAATDILGAALAPLNTPCLFRLVGGFSVAGVLSVTITRGGNTQVQQFNGGVPLNVNSLYMFDHLVHAGDTINYQYSVNAVCMTLRVQEIVAATQ